eukprot:6487985-Amphidinium_carterae.6
MPNEMWSWKHSHTASAASGQCGAQRDVVLRYENGVLEMNVLDVDVECTPRVIVVLEDVVAPNLLSPRPGLVNNNHDIRILAIVCAPFAESWERDVVVLEPSVDRGPSCSARWYQGRGSDCVQVVPGQFKVVTGAGPHPRRNGEQCMIVWFNKLISCCCDGAKVDGWWWMYASLQAMEVVTNGELVPVANLYDDAEGVRDVDVVVEIATLLYTELGILER